MMLGWFIAQWAGAPLAAHAGEPFMDANKTCTMKITDQENDTFLVAVICEHDKKLTNWLCPEVEQMQFTPYECREQLRQQSNLADDARPKSTGRLIRIYAESKERVPHVLCGRLCKP